MSNKDFPYTPLNPDKKEIRVITITPEKHPEKPLRCSLQIVSLNEHPKFEALSYVWGDVVATTEISVENLPFNVTTNLAAALRSLRHLKKPRTLWIDFICIDQENTKEKNKQLPLMGRIYQDAIAVVAWLGPQTENIEHTDLMMRDKFPTGKKGSSSSSSILDEIRHITKAPFFSSSSSSSSTASRRRQELVSTTRAIEGFIEIVSAPYWKRVWTFQEYYLPSVEPVCICGSITFSLPALVSLHKHFLGLLQPFMNDINAMGPKENDAADAAEYHELRTRSGEFTARLREFATMQGFAHDIASLRKSSWSFADVLDLTVERQCFNPLDRFYGLYALVPGIQEKYPANYDNTPEIAMLQTSMFILIHEGMDFVFNLFHFHEASSRGLVVDGPLPSWVPDYRNSTVRSGFKVKSLDKGLEDWETKEGRMTNLSLLPFKFVLHFWARLVGRCRVVFRFAADLADIVDRVVTVSSSNNSSSSNNNSSSDNNTGLSWGNGLDSSNFRARFLWACLAHTILQQNFTLEEVFAELTDLHQALRAGDDIPRKPHTSCMAELVRGLRQLAGKTVFCLPDSGVGGFGTGIGAIQDEDLLILSGKMMNPVALRELGTKKMGDSDRVHYEMVGNVFVEGLAEDQRESPTPLLGELKDREFEEYRIE
ncbi:hypothetical protein FE257_003102 [Aspergillus nanangensis]|uniref:Heterokaryon incompatibility domain-containing protein n=1 Tax=Aspergillus nanangensis TaxID=2582783 RepID=A0AAD4CD66_ASPNN|nr:hypothetical protein FE257_003102 [Aspergillus nanangensis]